MIKSIKLPVTALIMAGFTSTAQAAPIDIWGFTFGINSDGNTPILSLENDSTSALITNMNFTIGDTSKNFHTTGYSSVNINTSPSGMTAVSNVSGRVDAIDISFTGFDPTEIYTTEVDVDRDSANTVENWATTFFNNGDALNSVLSVSFSNGQNLSLTLEDDPNRYIWSVRQEGASDIPLPAPLALMGLGLAGLGISRRRAKAA